MTENIFANGGEFCMRGDPEHRPVEWCWLKTLTKEYRFPVIYVTPVTKEHAWVTVSGAFHLSGSAHNCDLIPIPQPPEYVPWESPDDVPDGIWIRTKGRNNPYWVNGFGSNGITFNGQFFSFRDAFQLCEYHTDRKAKDGWQVCGKIKS